MLYKAFISYSHAADGRLAPALQRALHGIAKPWYRLRTMRVFRDQTNLATSPGLWTSIEDALRESEYFLFLASPAAAYSPWVAKEVAWWLRNRSPSNFLIILTDGTISWDGVAKTLDLKGTTAIPADLGNAFPEEPLYNDLRWARSLDHLSLRHSQFRAAVLDVAATLLGRPKDELDGDDVRQHRRNQRIAVFASCALAVLFLAASVAAYLATEQSKLATSRALGARSEAVLPTDPELALLLAREAVRVTADGPAEHALRRAIAGSPQQTIHHASAGTNVIAAFASASDVVAAVPGTPPTVWNVNGRQLKDLSSPVGDRIDLVRSADGDAVVLQSEDGFEVYDRTWKRRASLPGQGTRSSADGTTITAVDEGQLSQWRIPSLKERKVAAALPEGYIVRGVSPDGSLLILTKDQEQSQAIVVQAESGHVEAKLPTLVFRDGDAMSPDGRFIVAEQMNDEDSVIELLDPHSGKLVRRLKPPMFGGLGWTTTIAFSPDGKHLAAGNRDGDVHVWDVETGEVAGYLNYHRNDVQKIVFSPSSGAMLSVAADGTACLWDLGSMRRLVTIGGKGDEAWDVAFSPDGHRFLTTHRDGSVRVWDVLTWYPQRMLSANQAILGKDGHLVVGSNGDGEIVVWNADSGQPVATLQGAASDLSSIAVDPSGSLVATAPVDGAVQLWDAVTGELTGHLGESSRKTSAIGFDVGGGELATGGEEGEVRFWSSRGGQLIKSWPISQNSITSVAFHPDGKRIVLTLWDGKAQVRDRESGQLILEVALQEEGEVAHGTALSPDGNLLMVFGDKVPQIWDLRSGTRLQVLNGHSDSVYSGVFAAGGQEIVTGSGYMQARGVPPDDGNAVHVWDASLQRELLSFNAAGMPVTGVALLNEGKLIRAASLDGMVRDYVCEACAPASQLVDLASARLGREMSASERDLYVPQNTFWAWLRPLD
ncbi:toll/interleukin-1 receptor domain-containing protein [Rhizobium ruizarguesonis]|nr:TIR domain-containing protein [Rhizobium ruizarguesonis]NKL10874.1 TIR domain-containing protein [Rhizobium leguminosarum bv. viciae]NEJ03106.1 TIR domain-containing protein [Rhizobium ruizarguesonis]NEJ40222.1 TIR domain-containing protein [Rhizobium ruizarguesonis]TAT91699.1 TIR domain-containing protein [Rhizobium ruizarguesonis]TAZ03640.1 TIR domain-containing protein [Rhizobium ruizarguesonis]